MTLRHTPVQRCLRRSCQISVVAALTSLVAPRPLLAESPAPSSCRTLLADLAAAAAANGYECTDALDHVVGTRVDQREFHAECDDAGQAALELSAADGSRVELALSTGASTLTGTFPGFGRVSQQWSSEAGGGRVRFTAEAPAAAAWAELDLASGDFIAGGEPERVNEWFRPALASSPVWRDAHLLMLALTDAWTADSMEEPNALDAMLDLAIPTTVLEDVDKGDVKKDCGSAIGVCVVAFFWKPASVGCVTQGIKCFAAFKCWKNDCSGDGKA